MGDANPICTLGDYSKPRHEGYKNTIELFVGNNVVPLQFDTIRSAKLRNDNLMFQQHQGESLSEAWTRFKDLLKKSLIMASIFGSKSRSFMTMSLPAQDEPLTNWLVDARLSKFKVDFKQQQSKMTNKINIVLKAITDRIVGALPSDTVKNPKLNVKSTTLVLFIRSHPTEDPQCSTHIHGDDGDVMFIHIVKNNDDSRKEELETGGLEVEYFDIFPTQRELAYHKYLMCGLIPLIFQRNPIITEGCSSNLKILCHIGYVHVEKAYMDLNSPLNIMTQMMYNWIIRRKLKPRENSDRGVSNFTGRIKGMHVFIGNFTYATNFMIVKDISSIIDPRLSQVVL
nr:MAK10-like protein [Tanacetum cinerariifolium]